MSEEVDLTKVAPIPWQCWEAPNFKECHKEAGHEAHRYLVSLGYEPFSKDPAMQEAWNTSYRFVHRKKAERCEVLSNCSADLLKSLTSKGASDSDILNRLRANVPQKQGHSTFTKLLAIGGGIAIVLYLNKRYRS